MNILCYVAPNCKDLFKAIVNGISNDANMISISMYNSCDETDFTKRYYERISNYQIKKDITQQDYEIYYRCRLLRELKFDEAICHIMLTRELVNSVITKIKPSMILIESTDQYIIDILQYSAKENNIPVVGLVRTFINGYIRFSVKGEMLSIRKPNDSEIDKVYNEINKDSYYPSNLISIKKNIFKWVFINWLKNIIKVPYFQLARKLPYSKFNYHYWSTIVVVLKYFLFLKPKFEVGDKNFINTLKSSKKKVILIPLQHVPEGTIDYWCDDLSVIDYHNYLIKLVSKLSKNFIILIKEHPGSIGFRNPNIYKKLKVNESVIFAPISYPSIDCINLCDAVLVWTGSIGFEAAFRGKPVFTVSNPYYLFGERFMRINIDVEIISMLNFIDKYSKIKITESEKYSMVSFLLNSFFKGTFRNDGSFKNSNPKHIAEANDLGKEIKKYYFKINA